MQAAILKGIESGDVGFLDINEIKAKAKEQINNW